MKIAKSIRDVYNDRKPKYEDLQKEVDRLVQAIKKQRWHYESRIKELESLALKIETGRIPDLTCIEDFFACTLVVENLEKISEAEKIIRDEFEFVERRPFSNESTPKAADTFCFDDLRLYVKWKDDPTLRPTVFNDLLFEVQIKSFLAHAWSIATHDLIYKADEKNWAKERVAYQVKAMLEHAEISIQEIIKISQSSSLKKTDKKTKSISKIIDFINQKWSPNSLPSNLKLLAENIFNLISNIEIDLSTLKRVIEEETKLGRGIKTLNLSPYSVIVQSLLNQEFAILEQYLTGEEREFKIFIPKEIDFPKSRLKKKLTNAILDK